MSGIELRNKATADRNPGHLLLHDDSFPERPPKSSTGRPPMTSQVLTQLVAERVMKWTAAPNRFMLGGRKWMPDWRFQPCQTFEHAIQLLDVASPTTYSLGVDQKGRFWARVEVDGVVGEASDMSRPRAVTIAVARAVGIDVEEVG